MNSSNTNQSNISDHKDFWDSLQSDILTSNQRPSSMDAMSLIERSFMFSIFFRGCSQLELAGFQTILNIKDNGYVLLAELTHSDKTNITDFENDVLPLHHFLKEILHNTNNTIGPLITNRICILVSDDTHLLEDNIKEESIYNAHLIMSALNKKFKISSSVGIGTVYNISSLYTSFIEALTSLHYSSSGQAIYFPDIIKTDSNQTFDYFEAEKYMLDAIRLHKIEAYTYFGLLMDWIRPMNDETKRNKIIETLVLASHAMRIDGPGEICFNFMGHLNELMEHSGDQLIEWAFHSFISITGFVKPQNSIDYSNRIVQATKEYLESHYSDDISLEDIAEQVNISPQYFSKLIKKTTGFNFIDWLSMLRVKKAKELLANSNITVKEVCFMVGYKDPNYFSRIFKKRIGLTPSEYVKATLINNKS